MSLVRSAADFVRLPGFSALASEPYRVYFPLGALLGVAGAAHWALYGSGLESNYSGFYHSSVQVWLFMGSFVAGFLMTAVPRLSGTSTASKAELLVQLALTFMTFFFLLRHRWAAAEACSFAWTVSLAAFVVRRFRRSSVRPPATFLWVPFGFFNAAAGSLILALANSNHLPAWMLGPARAMTETGFLLCLVLGVGGFLGPRLMGIETAVRPTRLRLLTIASAAAALTLSFWVPEVRTNGAGFAFRALLATVALGSSGCFRRPLRPGLFTALLRVSFVSVAAGLWGQALFPVQQVLMAHILFISGFALMIWAVGTMVILRHSGRGERLEGRPPILVATAIVTAASLLIRLTAQLAPESYFLHLGLAGAFWALFAACWAVFAIRYALIVPSRDPDESDKDCGPPKV